MSIPKTKDGKILWQRVPGFADWVRKHGPSLTGVEMAVAIQERFGVPVSSASVENIRKRYGVHATPETLKRAYQARENRIPKEPALPPTEQMDRQMLRQQVKALSQRQTLYEVIGEAIVQAVQKLRPLPPPRYVAPPKASRGGHEDTVFQISDMQIGQRVDASESGGLGNFGVEILLEEIEYFQGAIDRIRLHHPECRHAHVLFEGDIVEGQTIWVGQSRLVDIDLVDQVIKAVEYLARFLNWLATRYEQVDCYCVVGNHGRLGRRGEFSPLNNFDYLVYRILEERLRETRAIRWTIPRTWWHVATIQGWRFLMLHGEDVLYNALGIPFYATRRMKTNYRELFELIKRVEGLKDAGFDFMAVGHHHEPAEFYGILMNGSWPGASEFSLKRLQAGGMPSQKIWGVHRDFGITWKRDVNLRPLRRPGAGQGS